MRESIPVWLTAALLAASPIAQEATPPASKPAQDPKGAEPTVLSIGDVVPPGTKLTTPEGKDFTFKDVRGKTVVIHFWSTTCPWEKVAEPKIMKLASDYKDKDVVTLAINANQGEIGAKPEPEAFETKDKSNLPYATLRAKADKVGMNHPVLLDHGGDVARLFAAKTTPHCFVLDGEGTLVYSGALDNDGKGELGDEAKHYVRQAVDAVRAGKKVETSTTKPYG